MIKTTSDNINCYFIRSDVGDLWVGVLAAAYTEQVGLLDRIQNFVGSQRSSLYYLASAAGLLSLQMRSGRIDWQWWQSGSLQVAAAVSWIAE